MKCIFFMRICSLRAVPFFVCIFRVRCVRLHQSYYDSIHPLCLCIRKILTLFLVELFFTIFASIIRFSSFSIVTEYVSHCVVHKTLPEKNIFICIRSFKAPPRFLLLFKNDDFALDNAKEWKKLGSQFIC